MSVKHIGWALKYQDLPEPQARGRAWITKSVFVHVVGFAEIDGPFPAIAEISDRTGIIPRTVHRVLQELHSHGTPQVMAAQGICGQAFLAGWTVAISDTPQRPPASKKPAPCEPRQAMPNEVVYVIGARGGTVVKIGTTTQPERRLRSIQGMSPLPLEMIWSVPGGYELESRLHAAFADHRVHGEWFDFGDANPVDAISAEVAGQ